MTNAKAMFNTNYPMPKNLDALTLKESAVMEKFNALETLHNDKNATASAMLMAENAVKDALKDLNKAIVEQWVSEIVSLPKEEAIAMYLNNAGELGGFRLQAPSKSEEASTYQIVSTLRYVSYAMLDKNLSLASSTVWSVYVGQFAHNVARHLCSKDQGVNAKAPTYYGTAPEKGSLFCKYDKKSLKLQMDAIAKAMRPEGMDEIHFHSHDVNFILYAVTKATSGAGATVSILDEKAFIRLIVTAMYFRLNNKEYAFQSKAKVHNKPNK